MHALPGRVRLATRVHALAASLALTPVHAFLSHSGTATLASLACVVPGHAVTLFVHR
ncbi:hypothetical protein [Parasulfuritortus cantonensis]|uniref:hypothetical protein n=1 Tax=Parasulfuritortus cantonensis TaxID=2528202 RepID=UPI001404566C|nr:hypothetical protein [Parasulfuritortus cantonensis]